MWLLFLFPIYKLNKLFFADYRDDTMLVSGTGDGELCLWRMDNYNLQSTIKSK
jgi:hypothetical protein